MLRVMSLYLFKNLLNGPRLSSRSRFRLKILGNNTSHVRTTQAPRTPRGGVLDETEPLHEGDAGRHFRRERAQHRSGVLARKLHHPHPLGMTPVLQGGLTGGPSIAHPVRAGEAGNHVPAAVTVIGVIGVDRGLPVLRPGTVSTTGPSAP